MTLSGSGNTTVVSFTIDPSFAGNLLIQASGDVSAASTTGASCQAFIDGNGVGTGSVAEVGGSVAAEAISVAGAAAVTAGTHTVSIQCGPVVGGTTPNVNLTAFALVAAS